MISAALNGHLDVLMELKQYSDPLKALAEDEDDYDDSAADKTEL